MEPATSEKATLRPLKAIIHGPPASGKTTLAKRICRRYGAHYVSVATMIDETMDDLRQKITQAKEKMEAPPPTEPSDADVEEEEPEDEEAEEEAEGGAELQAWEEQLRDIAGLLGRSECGRLPDDYVVRLMRSFLVNESCQAHGYVLDGFPKIVTQARELFGQAAEGPKEMAGEGAGGGGGGAAADERGGGGGAEGGEGGEGAALLSQVGGIIGNASNRLMPDFVLSLQATDQFLCERVMRMPQRVIQGTHYDEINMIRRLAEFRENNTTDNTILNFFDEVGIHPILIDLAKEDDTEDLQKIYEMLCEVFGEPIPGLGLSLEEEQELRRLEQKERKLRQEAYNLERKIAEEKAKKEYEDKMEKWAEILEKLQMEEEKIMTAQAEPLRFYLMTYVFPTLTKGLMEVVKVKPADPVDFLAEFLFKENPEGKMFDPSFTRDGEELLKSYETDVKPTMDASLSKQ